MTSNDRLPLISQEFEAPHRGTPIDANSNQDKILMILLLGERDSKAVWRL